MNAPPLLIATCPGRTIPALRAEIQAATAAGADVAEIRLDRLPPAEREHLTALFPTPLPLLATVRSTVEGGEGPNDPSDRARDLRACHRLGFQFLDLELARDSALAEEWGAAEGPAPRIFLSAHRSGRTSTEDLRRLLETSRPPGAVVKLVLPCTFNRLWEDLLPGLQPLDRFAPYVLHTTGTTGPLLRAWAGRLGMSAVFSSLPERFGDAETAPVEPAQIPVDRLRGIVAGGSHGPLFAVVGKPVAHSRSPGVHSLWFRAEARSALFVALEFSDAQEFAESVGPLADGGFRGLNVTHPWKQVALGLASRAGAAAEAAGCANTLTLDHEEVAAENTDVAAVRRRLRELRDAGTWDDSPVTVLGAGGAARAVLSALATVGASAVVVARRSEAAEALAREFGATVPAAGSLRPTRLVVHATPAGRDGEGALALPWESVLGPETHVLDFVYAPAHPFLQAAARSRGGTYEDGSRLLVYQAAESYAIWWGSPPSRDLQEQALREVVCAA